MDTTNDMAPTPRQRVKGSGISILPDKSPVIKRRKSARLETSASKRQRTIPPSTNSKKPSNHRRDNNQLNQQDQPLQLRPPPIRSPQPRIYSFFEPLPQPPKELDGVNLQAVLDKKRVYLGPNQKKSIYRWMWQHNTRTVKGCEFEFKMLLATLGFSNALFSPQLTELLRLRVRRQIRQNSIDLERLGAFTMVWDKQKKKKIPLFAEWTEAWMSKSWDGSPERPRWTQLFLNPYFGEARGWLHMRVPVPLNEENESDPIPETFVVEESEAIEGPGHLSDNLKPEDSTETHEEAQNPGKLPDRITFESFKFLCGPALPVSNTGYAIDVSQLPQYHGVQLTPNDPYHPLRPDPSFTHADLDLYDESDYEEEEYEEDVEYRKDVEYEEDVDSEEGIEYEEDVEDEEDVEVHDDTSTDGEETSDCETV